MSFDESIAYTESQIAPLAMTEDAKEGLKALARSASHHGRDGSRQLAGQLIFAVAAFEADGEKRHSRRRRPGTVPLLDRTARLQRRR